MKYYFIKFYFENFLHLQLPILFWFCKTFCHVVAKFCSIWLHWSQDGRGMSKRPNSGLRSAAGSWWILIQCDRTISPKGSDTFKWHKWNPVIRTKKRSSSFTMFRNSHKNTQVRLECGTIVGIFAALPRHQGFDSSCFYFFTK